MGRFGEVLGGCDASIDDWGISCVDEKAASIQAGIWQLKRRSADAKAAQEGWECAILARVGSGWRTIGGRRG
ncbi:hypothetical protein CKO23_02275 [Thiocystis violacea]|nr:hypothetical protein [Thiocystis violacea]